MILGRGKAHRELDRVARHGEAVVSGGILLYVDRADRAVGLLVADLGDGIELVRISQNRNQVTLECRIGEEAADQRLEGTALRLCLGNAQAFFIGNIDSDV